MKELTKEDILNSADINIQPMDVPEWGGTIYIKSMSGKERDEFEASIKTYEVTPTGKDKSTTKVDIKGLKVILISLVVCDKEGKLLFTRADVDKLNQKSAKPLQNVFEKAQELNGLGEKAIKELTKNSEGEKNEGSGSDSPVSSECQSPEPNAK